jgi:hypothetical protein
VEKLPIFVLSVETSIVDPYCLFTVSDDRTSDDAVIEDPVMILNVSFVTINEDSNKEDTA